MKRKLVTEEHKPSSSARPKKHSKVDAKIPETLQVQIVVGTYDRVLHGVTASLPRALGSLDLESTEETTKFVDNFKFTAHRSAIRCLASSPLPSLDDASEARRIFLASGGTDGCVNIYQIDPFSRSGPAGTDHETSSSARGPSQTNTKNEAIGSLYHHSSYINSLEFSSRAKLFSAADDSTIAVSRTRDWTVLTTLKAPIPEVKGRPSGDTAPLGTAPSGINDFSIHPSKKLMISVSKGDTSMRLWNLVTGKKAGKLDFEPSLLRAVGTRRGAKAEGSRVEWNHSGDEFVICFERGAAAFSMDCKSKGVFRAQPDSKIHRIRYLPAVAGSTTFLIVGTEDGRLIFASTDATEENSGSQSQLPSLKTLGEVGGVDQGNPSRVKDFEVIRCITENLITTLLVVTVSSDGNIRLWDIRLTTTLQDDSDKTSQPELIDVIGSVVGTYSTESRITCLTAFLKHTRIDQDSVVNGVQSEVAVDESRSKAKPHERKSKEGESDEEFDGLDSDAG